MHTIIVYLDEAEYAIQHLAALRHKEGENPTGSTPVAEAEKTPTHWVLVGCAPRMTHRISKWVSHSARENWRNKWSEKLFGQTVPLLQAQGAQVSTVLAKGPLVDLTERLLAEHRGARVLDARRPRMEQGLPPMVAQAHPNPVEKTPRWTLPGAVMVLLGSVLLAAE